MAVKQAILGELSPLPHAREVQDYLLDLSVAITGKKHPPADYIQDLNRKSRLFVTATDLHAVLDDIKTIFREQGYKEPWDIENDLIRKNQPGIPEAAIRSADFYAAQEMTPDHLTGYFHKTQVPLVMGLSALYEQTTGNPVSVLEVDYSNMRGTNDHFAKLLAVAENASIHATMQDAMALTDRASYIVAQTITDTLSGALQGRDEIAMIPLRTGGDEVRIVLPNLEPGEAKMILKQIHDNIEMVTARIGLHDHIHTKRPLDEWSNGFGACGTVFALKATGQNDFNDAIQNADLAIQAEKVKLGRARLDNESFEPLKPPGSTDPARYKDATTASQYLESVLSNMAELYQGKIVLEDYAPDIPQLEDIAVIGDPSHFLTLDQIQERFHDHLGEDLKEQGITLTRAQEKLLNIKVTKFPAQDYATGTLMARDLPAMTGAALAVTDILNKKFDRVHSPWTLGVSFHNLAGLNEALGHEKSNIVLHHQAHAILEESLFRVGIGRENMVLAHMGGGEFRAVIQPLIPQEDGTIRVIGATDIQKIETEITSRTQSLNRTKIAAFFAHYGITQMDDTSLPEYFSGLPNPRTELRDSESGITATISARLYAVDMSLNTHSARRGGAVVAFIGDHLETAIRERRANDALRQTSTFMLQSKQDHGKLL
jgi:GGDEF domain-containing protein